MSFDTFKKLNLEKLDSYHLPHIVGASGESLGTLGKTSCEYQNQQHRIHSNIHNLRTPEKTTNLRQRFLNSKPHGHIVDESTTPDS